MVATTALGTIAGQIAAKGFGALFGEIIKQSIKSSSASAESIFSGNKVQEYFRSTFERCTKVRTLLNRDSSVDLLQTYINVLFNTRDTKGEEQILDDYDLIERLPSIRKCIIIGTAGGGKTVFMRYLWVSLFTNPEGRIPIYLELRRLNDLTSIDLISFITHNCMESRTEAATTQFRKMMADGTLIFILDGFDEVSVEKRVAVERQIIEVGRRYPKSTIVVSGRPDDKFDAWQEFQKFNVRPLSKEQVTNLVERVDFDEMVKSKFIAAVKKDLYEKHESFLSSPLLATMMLLTFRYYAEIPNKIHVFYDLAFDTLFSMHDALKEAFSRKKYTDLPIDVFKRRLSCFCLVSYMDQKFEFTHTEVLDYINRSAKIDNVKINATDFLQDLLESVCIMQRDGLNISFTHRSFQEYFSSCCLVNFGEDKLSVIIPRLAKRRSDNVLVMLFDMSRDLVEKSYILPNLIKQKEALKAYGVDPSGPFLLEALGFYTHIRSDGKSVLITGTDVEDGEEQDFRRILQALYPSLFRISNKKYEEMYNTDIGLYETFPLNDTFKDDDVGYIRLSAKKGKFSSAIRYFSKTQRKLSDSETEKLANWFMLSGHYQYFQTYYKKLWGAAISIPRAHRKRHRDTDGLLGIFGS